MNHSLSGFVVVFLAVFLALIPAPSSAEAASPAGGDIKALIDGTWCTDEEGSYIQREGLESPTLIEKGEICHTFKVTHAGDGGGVGRMYESYYHADLKDLKISREVLDDPEAVHQDAGVFSYRIADGGVVELSQVDVTDNTFSLMRLSVKDATLTGAYLETGNASSQGRHGFAGHLLFRKDKPLDASFDSMWKKLDDLAHP